MGKVIVLDQNTVNRIAAGEVVERPASVVKELIENSLDAGSRSVTVEIQGGGSTLIRVVDDGHGMDREDALLALERHATSKITCVDDIPRSGTLGFRGEALPSIASVSRLEIVTRAESSSSGTRVLVEGGKVISVEDVGSPIGTTVTVRDLFYNTPARLKFLKSRASETARAVDAALRAALSAHGVRFRVVVDGKETLRTPGGELFDALVSAYGTEFARSLVAVEWSAGGVFVSGFVGKPQLHRSSRSEQFFTVNGRVVRDNGIRWALEEAYSGSVPRGRYPVAFLEIRVNPDDVDVNVHPAKTEVRFKDDRTVRSAVLAAVSRAVMNVGAFRPDTRSQPAYGSKSGGPAGHFGPGARGSSFDAVATGSEDRPSGYAQMSSLVQALREPAPSHELRVDLLVPIGQVFGTYIVAEYSGGLALIDQHAAHERINYEQIRLALKHGRRMVQPLMLPCTLTPGPVERVVYTEYRDSLREMGYDVEEFGGQSLLVRSRVSVAGVDIPLEAVLAALALDRPVAREEWPGERAVAALASCVASAKAGQYLDLESQRALIKALSETDDPLRCPHGRPTVILIERAEIERRFGRR